MPKIKARKIKTRQVSEVENTIKKHLVTGGGVAKNTPKFAVDKIVITNPREQLYWFAEKLVSASQNPRIEEYNEVIYFPVDLLRKETTGLFPLGRNASATVYDSEDQEYASYCNEMLEKIKRDIYKLRNKNQEFDEERFTWWEDNNEYSDGYNIAMDYGHKPLLEAYLGYLAEQRGAKSNIKIIEKIDVLEDKTEMKAIVMYVNGNYNNPIQFNRRKYFGLFYTLARDQEISYKKGFFDYFNSNTANPLYKNTGFKRSSIIKKEYDYIKPNIPITLRTQKFISQAKNNA